MSDKIITANQANFAEVVLSSKIPVIADFWADWCGPCKALAPTLEQLALAYDGKIAFAKVDVMQNEALAKQLSVQSLPTLLFIAGGKVKKTAVGNLPLRQLEAECESFLELLANPPSAEAESAHDAAVDAAKKRRDQRTDKAFQTYLAACQGLPEVIAIEQTYKPLEEAVEAELTEEKAKKDAGEISERDYNILANQVRLKLSTDGRFAELMKKVEELTPLMEKAIQGDLQTLLAERQAAGEEYDTAVAEATEKLKASVSKS